jgi:signal transduction histidine kinase/ligand-binding sensor domain-containing protein/DNA-binding NarL/FixJ family response regulator
VRRQHRHSRRRAPAFRLAGAVLLLCFGLLASVLQAADKPLALRQYQYWTSEDGLAQNSITAVGESHKGIIWLASHEGITRFDGARLDPVPALRGGSFEASATALWVAPDDALWVATVGRGVARLQIHESHRYWTRADGLPSDAVLSVLGTSDGRLFAGTAGGVAWLEGERFAPVPGLPLLKVQGIASDPQGNVWFAARGQPLYRLAADGAVDSLPLPGGSAGAVVVAGDGTLWASTQQGLLRRDSDGSTRLYRQEDGLASLLLRHLLLDRDGSLWIAHEGYGLQRYAHGRFEPFDLAQGLHHRFVQALFQDSYGALWIGTSLGVGRLRDAPVVTFDQSAGLAGNFVRTVVATPEGVIWAGSDDGGLTRIDGYRARRYGLADGLLGESVRSLGLAPDGALWIAVFGHGLQRRQGDHWQSWTTADGLPSALIRTLLVEPDGGVWLGTADNGLVHFADGRFRTIDLDHGLPSNDIRSLLRRRNGDLVVGTGDAGIAVLVDGQVTRRFLRSDGLPSERVFALFEDARRRLWIGSENGLALLEDGRLRDLGALGDTFSRAVFFIVDDAKQGLWLTGNRGLTHFPAASIEQLRIWSGDPASAPETRRIERSDGLSGQQINGGTQPAGARAADGRLWLPTARGLAMIDPARLTHAPSLPRMQIESVQVNGEVHGFKNSRLALAAGQNRIEIGYGGVYTPGIDQPHYQTRLDGLDLDWNKASGDRSAEYAALSPGRYRFRVRAVSAGGVPGVGEAAIDFQIAPFVWQQAWFWLLAGLGMVGFVAAVVARRHRRLIEERSQLSVEVALRTRELSEALVHTQRLMRAKTTFLANMSHELRTPLTAILGFAEQALQNVPRHLQPALLRIERHARLLLELVNDVLDASRIDAGQLVIEPQLVAPLAVIDEAVALLGERAREKGLYLRILPHWPLPALVQGDPLRLKQILLNLIGNAIKFSDRGEVTIEVAADPDDGHWWFDVIDQGIGISIEQQQRLFRAFEQADVSTSRRYGGSGLGLYISRQLAEQMGGRIGIDSEPGRGSRFRVELPLPAAPEWIDRPPPRPAARTEAPAAPQLTGRVLIAEDVDDLRELFTAMVGATGASVVMVENGQQAVDRALHELFDLILMDIHMPVMDGREATRLLRDRGYRGPIIALTADVLGENIAAHRLAGCDAVLSKPIERLRLYELLVQHLPAAMQPAGRSGDLEALQARLSQRFSERMAEESAALCRDHADGDDAALAARLHRLKGAAGMFGHPEIGHAAQQAETALHQGDRLALERAMARLIERIGARDTVR